MTCPFCGHSDVDFTYEERSVSALYGPPVAYDARVDRCPNCNESGDFDGENDRAIEVALDLSSHKSVTIMAGKLESEHNCSRPYIERVSGLPHGSIAKCETGEYNMSVVMVLRMACTFPPILMMLDNAINHMTLPERAEGLAFGERYKDFLGATEGLPSDTASQHDHYRLGIPKR